MSDAHTLRLAIGLLDRSDRAAATRRLAEHAGALEVFALVEDAELHVLVPAPGFAPSLPGGRIWRALLDACATPGVHRGLVPPVPAAAPCPAVACSAPGVALIFVGPETDEGVVEQVLSIVAAIGSSLRAEQEVTIATGALRAAQEGARNARALAHALDVARTDLESKARSLDEALSRAEQGTRAKDEFLAMLGHELRNPLAPILTALQLLRFRGKASHEQDIIERHVAHLMRLVDDLLDVSRITRGKIDLRKECVELADIVARAIETASPLLEVRRQTLRVNVAAKGLALDADPERLGQVFTNLLTNASRYSEVGRAIVLSAERARDLIRVRVVDEGIGIESHMLERIFGAFVQGGDRTNSEHTNSAQAGLGLGLAIVRSLVALHGGTAHATSLGKGRGSEFVVELPASRGDPQVALASSGIANALQAVHEHAPQRVLVVDDNEDAAELVSEMLAALGHEVRMACDGPSALAVVRDFTPSIALLDIGLPVMDGFELAERLLAFCAPHRPRIIAITGYGQDADRDRSRAAGFHAHLVKPVDFALLQRVVAAISRELAAQ